MLRKMLVPIGIAVLFLITVLSATAANVTVNLGYIGNNQYSLVANTANYKTEVLQTDVTGTATSPIFYQRTITNWISIGNRSGLIITPHSQGWNVSTIQVKDHVNGSIDQSVDGWMLLYLGGEPVFLKRENVSQTPAPTATPIIAPTITPTPGSVYLPLLQR